MFGAGIVGSQENVPQWIQKVVSEIESEYGICLDAIYFKEAKSNDYRGGCYCISGRNLQLYFGRQYTHIRLWVVLHEMAHAIQHLELPHTLTKREHGRRNRVVHNTKFFEIARRLYIKYGVLETAAKHEYKRARKLMVV